MTCQQDRIDKGLFSHGSIVAREGESVAPVDLVYANDSERWEAALTWRDTYSRSAKVVLNCLDLCEHCDQSTYNPYAQVPLLRRADAVTSISHWTQSQLRRYMGLDSTVIYNPIKDVTDAKRVAGVRPYPYRVLLAGRLGDTSKRAPLAIQALILAGFTEAEVATVGPQPIGFGTHLGVVSDETLNDLYNSVECVLMTSHHEGLGLPGLEALAGGAIPIVCQDLTTAHEWYPLAWMCYPSPHSIAYRLRLLMDNPALLAQDQREASEMGVTIRNFLSGTAVAGRILEVYQLLIKPSP